MAARILEIRCPSRDSPNSVNVPPIPVLFSFRLDQETLRAMKGMSKKLRVQVRAQRIGSPWVDGAVSGEQVYETEKSVKFPNK